MANASTTSSLAKRWSNVVAPSSWISREGSTFVFPSPHSGRGHEWSVSGIFASCGPFGVRRAVNLPLVQSISGFQALNDGTPRTWLYAFIGTTITSDSLMGSTYSKYCTRTLASRLSFADFITRPLRPWVEVNAGLWGNSDFLSRLGDIKMLVAPQLISALTRCKLPSMSYTRTSWMICAEYGFSVPHRYWLDIRARPSRMTFDFKAIWCGCISSKVANKAWLPTFSNHNSISSSLSHRVRYQER